MLNIFIEGFKKYKFKNKRYDYEIIKYLSFIALCFNSIFLGVSTILLEYINNFKEIFSSLVNLKYIDRIKVLLAFILNFLKSIKCLLVYPEASLLKCKSNIILILSLIMLVESLMSIRAN